MLYSDRVTCRPLACLLLIACLLAGCQAKPPEASHSSATPQQTDDDSSVNPNPEPSLNGRPVIIAFGDSLTAGYGADTGDSYPDYLQKDLDAEGYHYQVVNQGISGNTTKGRCRPAAGRAAAETGAGDRRLWGQ